MIIFVLLEIDFVFEIRVNKEWNERLRDKASDKFKELSTLLKEEVYLEKLNPCVIH